MNRKPSIQDIKVVRVTQPDEDKGGKMVDGAIVGPQMRVNRWRIKDEPHLFDDRRDAEKEIRNRLFTSELFDAMGFVNHRPTQMTPIQIVKLVQRKGKNIKNVLNQQKYAKLLP